MSFSNKIAAIKGSAISKIKLRHGVFLLALILAVKLALYNDLYFRPTHYAYDNLLRCGDHILAGIFAPPLLYFLKAKEQCKYYIMVCLIVELSQIFEHGYFQLNQFLCDITGALIFYLIYYNFILRMEWQPAVQK